MWIYSAKAVCIYCIDWRASKNEPEGRSFGPQNSSDLYLAVIPAAPVSFANCHFVRVTQNHIG